MKKLKTHVHNLRGWRAPRRVLAIQSDDWGALRTSSPEALGALRGAGLAVDRCHYTRLDSLEGEEDLEALFRVLQRFQDHRGNPVRFTANCLMANPDFESIASTGYRDYCLEPVRATAQGSLRTKGIVDLWRQGHAQGFFIPQLHGREHLNIARWMRDLAAGDRLLRLAFDHQTYAISSFLFSPKRKSYLAALDSETAADAAGREEIVADAVTMFRDTLGFRPESFIAPNYNWDGSVEDTLYNHGVMYLQSSRAQTVSQSSRQDQTVLRHYQGQRNRNGQTYIVRNVQFEPAENSGLDWVNSALAEIASAFLLRKPAVISTHRVNFIGHLSPANRERNLKQLDRLLEAVLLRWPDVEFWTTAELGKAMCGEDRP